MKLKLLVVEDHPDMRARVVSLFSATESGMQAKMVFISASGDVDQMNACLDAGGDAHVWKMLMGEFYF